MFKMRKLDGEQQQAAGGNLRERRRPCVARGGRQQAGYLEMR
jgi:hypothetical protein